MREGREVCCDSESPMSQTPYGGTCCNEKCDEIGKIREICIKQVNYGYIVNVGCHTFAVESAVKLGELLNKYLMQPNATEKLWYDGTLFK